MTYVYATLAHFIFKKMRVAEGISKYLPKNAMKLRKFPHLCWVEWGGGGGGRWGGGGWREMVAIFNKKNKLKSEMFKNKKS